MIAACLVMAGLLRAVPASPPVAVLAFGAAICGDHSDDPAPQDHRHCRSCDACCPGDPSTPGPVTPCVPAVPYALDARPMGAAVVGWTPLAVPQPSARAPPMAGIPT